jgi:CHAT domain-containing protein
LREVTAGNHDNAEHTLFKIETIGRFLFGAEGDTSITDFANYLRNLPTSERKTELELMGHYFEAEELFSLQKYSDAKAIFERLSGEFADRGNHVFQVFSTYYTASCSYASGYLASSLEILKEALAISEKQTWPYRQAQLFNQLGIAYSRLGHDSLAIKYCGQAVQAGHNLAVIEAKALQFISAAYGNLGDLDNALASLRQSTKLSLENAPESNELANNYLNIADIYRVRGNHSLALLYARHALNFSDQANDNNRGAQASAFVAVELAHRNQVERAEEELKRAFGYLEKIEKGQRVYTESVVLTRAGEMVVLRGDLERAVGYYSKAETLLEKAENKAIPLMRVLRRRAEADLQAKEYEKARLDLERAIALLEDYRASIDESKNRSSFLDASHSVFDQMIRLNVRAPEHWSNAFDFSEQSRARTLLDEFSLQQDGNKPPRTGGPKKITRINPAMNRQVKPLTIAEVQTALPDDLRLLTYSVTDQGTYIFLVTRSGLDVAESSATTEILDRLTHDYVEGLKSKAPVQELSKKARELYQYLIQPVEGRLGDGKTLCIVPDKALHFLPFAALIDRSGRYLIGSYSLMYAPSASALVRCIKESRAKDASKAERILAVGNPQFDHDEFPALERLPDAEREASESATFYADRIVLNGAQATERAVREELKNCNVAHLALHCLVEEKSPWLAALVLASKGPGGKGPDTTHLPDDGLLQLNEIYSISLPRTSLVILSACQSGLGQYYRGEGIVSLVRPFLALKVPTVVASLWSVDSQATANLMIEFHRQRNGSVRRAGDALRAAQIRMAESDPYQHPYYWAPFIAVGSNN